MSKKDRISSTLELRGVSRNFGPVKALDGLDLVLAPGELVALLGPSGCGKTTALRIVAGLEVASSGELFVNGESDPRLRSSLSHNNLWNNQNRFFIAIKRKGCKENRTCATSMNRV